MTCINGGTTMSQAWKKQRWLCIVLLLAIGAHAENQEQESGVSQGDAARADVVAAIAEYFRGHATGDPAHMRKAFLRTAHIEGIRDGKFVSWTLDEYCALFKGLPASDEPSRVRTIDSIDVSGNAAMAKATLDHGATIFTDYFVLLNVEGEWKIANKVYYGRARLSGDTSR
jgi:hypothetical protein